MLNPRPLRPGDTIGLVGVSGAMHEPETRFEKMLEVIGDLGYKVIVADSCREEYGYLSGSDASRARGLNRMFRDDRVDAVVCMRGGYGVARMLDQVDFDVIRANPKILLGYSDITALHTAIHEKAGLVTLHGPMPDRAWMEFDDFSRESMLRALTSTEPLGRLENPAGMEPRCVVPGRCEGLLVGGNLSMLYSLCGSPSDISTRGKILFIEDLDEYLYHIDRMLQALRRAGMLDHLAALVVGGMSDMHDNSIPFGRTPRQMVLEAVGDRCYPVLFDAPVGHLGADNQALPLGTPMKIMCDDSKKVRIFAP